MQKQENWRTWTNNVSRNEQRTRTEGHEQIMFREYEQQTYRWTKQVRLGFKLTSHGFLIIEIQMK